MEGDGLITNRILTITWYVICTIIALFLLSPIFIAVPLSFNDRSYLQMPQELSLRWYYAIFSNPEWLRSLGNSIKIGLLTTLISLILGTSAALGLTKAKFKGQQVLAAFLLSPIITPLIVIAIGTYSFYARIGFIGNLLGVAIAHAVIATPFVLITVSASLQSFDYSLEEAALSLGANRWKSFFQIKLPLIKMGIFAGGVFAFVTSFDELIIALFVSGVMYRTFPIRMWDGLRFEITPVIAAASSLMIAIYIIFFISLEIYRGLTLSKGGRSK